MESIESITTPIFKLFLAISCGSGVVVELGGQLYLETFCKHRFSDDFVYSGACRSGTYVNMVKVAFERGENRCQVMHALALAGSKYSS